MVVKLSRDFTNKINWVIDNLIPPILRDSKFINIPIFIFFFGNNYKHFMDFKNVVFKLDKNEFRNYYKLLGNNHISRETDLNISSIKEILDNLKGNNILDISCGRGFLANKIAELSDKSVTGLDIVISDELKTSKNPLFLEGNIEQIPFPDKYFNTVISTHTLEHVVNIELALGELRRVCKNKLIIVVPKQRPYKYTLDLHVHFFPYLFSVVQIFGYQNSTIKLINNDWVYMEDIIN